MCKWWAPKLAYETIYQCLLMHGHGGYDRGPMEQRLRDVLGFQIGDGTAQIMKNRSLPAPALAAKRSRSDEDERETGRRATRRASRRSRSGSKPGTLRKRRFRATSGTGSFLGNAAGVLL